MARKIKFPLIMENDVKVRSLEALKENFDIYQVFTYYRSGKLLLWLKNIYLDEEADKVKNLDSTEDIPVLSRQLYEVFGLPYTAIDEEKAEKIQDRENRKKRLQEKTSNDEILERIDEVAFDNEELDMRLKEGCKEIFLCGEAFTIPVEFENVTYYGVNKPVVSLSTEWVDLDEKKIRFKDIKPDYSLIRNNRIKNGRKHFNDEYDNTVKVTDSKKVKQLYRKIVRQMQACYRKLSIQVLDAKGTKETRKISIALNDFCKLDKYEFEYQPSIHDVTDVAFDVCGRLAKSIIYYISSGDFYNCPKFNEKYNEFKKGNSFDCCCYHMCFCVEKNHSYSRKLSDYKGMNKVVALRFVFFFLYCLTVDVYSHGNSGAQRLTKACELALCMKLSEDEVLDLVTVLLIINGLQESSKEQFKTKTVWDNFNCVLNCGYNPLPEEEKPTDT
ncbi:MAG: hypothetical protein Q4A04_05125 [Eubacteriales bacterium]|nr:hypothetical protein [Eubacteriales bacterium]